jgi:hypothetical protein
MPSDSEYLRAWGHVSAMGESQLRNEYATLLTNPSIAVKKVLSALLLDVAALLVVMRSEEGLLTFKSAIEAIEGGLLFALLQ